MMHLLLKYCLLNFFLSPAIISLLSDMEQACLRSKWIYDKQTSNSEAINAFHF